MFIFLIESSPDSAKDALLSVLNKSGDVDVGEDLLDDEQEIVFRKTIQDPLRNLDPLRSPIDPLQGLDIYNSSDMGLLGQRSSNIGLYHIGLRIDEQTNNNRNKTGSDLRYASSPAEEVSEEFGNLLEGETNYETSSDIHSSHTSLDRKYSGTSGHAGLSRKYSGTSDICSTSHVTLPESTSAKLTNQKAPTLLRQRSCDSQPITGQVTTQGQGQTIKTRSVSRDSGLSTLPPSGESTLTHPLSSMDRSSTEPSLKAASKKLTHYRSMSDYGLPHKAISEDGAEGKNSETTSLSSSLPSNQKGEFQFKIMVISGPYFTEKNLM